MITFSNDDMSEDLACLVENDVILEGILRQLEPLESQIEIRHNSLVKQYKLPQNNRSSSNTRWAQVILNNGDHVQARLLVCFQNYFLECAHAKNYMI